MARSEDDLRAAFLLAAQDAPSTAEVLAKLAAAERPPAKPRRAARIGRARAWLPAIAVAAVIAAIVVPITVFGRHSGSGSSASSLIAGAPEKAAAGDVNGGSSAAAASSAASAPFVAPSGASGPSGPVCTPADVTLALVWAKDGDRLIGKLQATNRTSTACDLAVKPAIYPLNAQGARLDVPQAVTAEGYAGPSRLLPGASAISAISWGSWCGTAAVHWGTGVSTVSVSGPSTPSCTKGAASNLTSNWFGPLA